MAGRLDDFTSARLAAYPLLRDHLMSPAGIWTDDGASRIAVSAGPRLTEIVNAASGWSGLDTPQQATFYQQATSAQGEEEQSIKVLGLEYVIPVFLPQSDRSALSKLRGHIHSHQPCLVGLEYPPPESHKYLVGSYWQGPWNRGYRGYVAYSQMPIGMKSQWGYVVEPQTAAAATPFTPVGAPYVVWAVELTDITATTRITLTPGAVPAMLHGLGAPASASTLTLTWTAGQIPARALICMSPPFRKIESYASLTEFSSYRYARRSGSLPRYIMPGQTYTLTAVGATASVGWLNNLGGI